MNLFSFDLRLLALLGGICVGIAAIIKEYQKVKVKAHKSCFLFFVLSVLIFVASEVWGIVLICSDFSEQVSSLCHYMVYSLALACFSFSCYVFTDAFFNGDVSLKDKSEGKVMFGLGMYFTLVALVSSL